VPKHEQPPQLSHGEGIMPQIVDHVEERVGEQDKRLMVTTVHRTKGCPFA